MYYIKIGKMYVNELSVDDECVDTKFIRNLELRHNKDYAYTVKEKDINIIQEILKEVLNLNEISFEKVEEKIVEVNVNEQC